MSMLSEEMEAMTSSGRLYVKTITRSPMRRVFTRNCDAKTNFPLFLRPQRIVG